MKASRTALSWLLALCLLPAFATALLRAQEEPLPGSLPGTERWVVWLKDRSFDLRQELAKVRAGATLAQRRQLLTQLDQLAANDQGPLATLVGNLGGAVENHLWTLNALVVEVPEAALATLRDHPRVYRLVPVRARRAADVTVSMEVPGPARAPLPIDTSTDANNHNVAEARSIITGAGYTTSVSRGAGSRIAIFDSGIDEDASGDATSGTPHPSFVDGQGASRIDAHLRAGMPQNRAVDCNNLDPLGGIDTAPPFAFRPCHHSAHALHGTAMAGIAAGNTDSQAGLAEGHAPEARIVDVSITVPLEGSTSFPTPTEVSGPWTTDDSTMLEAIEQLRGHIAQTLNPVHVLNISFDGWSDPLDPVPTALDLLAQDEDILVVTSAGNENDFSILSYGFYNGLAVGATHARTDALAPFWVMAETSRGPLLSDLDRFYPDVCATGAGTGTNYFATGDDPIYLKMPFVDTNDAAAIAGNQSGCPFGNPFPSGNYLPQGKIRYARGTSEAAAQVSGAAALYRAVRIAAQPPATAEETRAAILLNAIGAAPGEGAGLSGQDQHSYSGRNSFGLGYVRDDVLARFAIRDSTIQPLHQVATITEAVTSVQVPYSGLSAGERYAVAICWPRVFDYDQDPPEASVLYDVDLRVLDGSQVLARSISKGNSYERVVFVAPSNSVTIEIEAEPVEHTFPVQVAARNFHPDRDTTNATFEETPVHAASGTVESLSAQCTHTARDLTPVRRVPLAYEFAYGSAGFGFNTSGSPTHPGLNIGASSPNAPGTSHVHFEIRRSEVVEQAGTTVEIGGLAFKQWRPFNKYGSAPLEVEWVKMESFGSDTAVTSSSLLRSTGNATTVLSTPSGFRMSEGTSDWVTWSFAEHALILPFTSTFTYNGNENLHVWIKFTSDGFMYVDGAGDVSSDYGMITGAPAGSQPQGAPGWCPVIGLLPAAQGTPGLSPLIEARGEPQLGQTVPILLSRAAGGGSAILYVAPWSPFIGTFNGCDQHVDSANAIATYTRTANFAGSYLFHVTLPLDSSLLHSELGLQALVGQGSNYLFSNALLVTPGGGLW